MLIRLTSEIFDVKKKRKPFPIARCRWCWLTLLIFSDVVCNCGFLLWIHELWFWAGWFQVPFNYGISFLIRFRCLAYWLKIIWRLSTQIEHVIICVKCVWWFCIVDDKEDRAWRVGALPFLVGGVAAWLKSVCASNNGTLDALNLFLTRSEKTLWPKI